MVLPFADEFIISDAQVNYFTLCLSGVNNRNVAKFTTLKTIAVSYRLKAAAAERTQATDSRIPGNRERKHVSHDHTYQRCEVPGPICVNSII